MKVFTKQVCFAYVYKPQWAYMPKIRLIGRMGWAVANFNDKEEEEEEKKKKRKKKKKSSKCH